MNIQFRAFHRAELQVDFPEQRQEHYRLEIENADNPPLEITGGRRRGRRISPGLPPVRGPDLPARVWLGNGPGAVL